jgi:N-acetylmuramoyl-L-alanine amidase
VPVTLARTSLSPLDSFTCPAVALEVAPLPASGSEAAAAAGSPAYQARVAQAVVAALLEWRRQWRQP